MLRIELASRPSPSAVELEDIHLRYSSSDGYAHQLLDLAAHPTTESPATWLIKRLFEDRKAADRKLAIRLLSLLPVVQSWQAKLHILQCLQHLELAVADVPETRTEIIVLLDSPNKLVRAWAYDGLYRLAQLRHSDWEMDMNRLSVALHEETPAVRARIRNLLG